MKKMVFFIVMALVAMPMVSFANTAAKSAGKSGGSATSASVSTGGIVVAGAAVAVGAAVALSSGGDGSSNTQQNGPEISDASADSLQTMLGTMTTAEKEATLTLLKSADIAEVAAAFDAIAAANEAGLTAAQIQSALADAQSRANPFTSGTDEYAAYEALVDAFAAVYSSSDVAAVSGLTDALATFVAAIDEDNLDAVVNFITDAAADGWDAIAEYADQFEDVDELEAALEEQTGNTTTAHHNSSTPTTTHHATTQH